MEEEVVTPQYVMSILSADWLRSLQKQERNAARDVQRAFKAMLKACRLGRENKGWRNTKDKEINIERKEEGDKKYNYSI